MKKYFMKLLFLIISYSYFETFRLFFSSFKQFFEFVGSSWERWNKIKLIKSNFQLSDLNKLPNICRNNI